MTRKTSPQTPFNPSNPANINQTNRSCHRISGDDSLSKARVLRGRVGGCTSVHYLRILRKHAARESPVMDLSPSTLIRPLSRKEDNDAKSDGTYLRDHFQLTPHLIFSMAAGIDEGFGPGPEPDFAWTAKLRGRGAEPLSGGRSASFNTLLFACHDRS